MSLETTCNRQQVPSGTDIDAYIPHYIYCIVIAATNGTDGVVVEFSHLNREVVGSSPPSALVKLFFSSFLSPERCTWLGIQLFVANRRKCIIFWSRAVSDPSSQAGGGKFFLANFDKMWLVRFLTMKRNTTISNSTQLAVFLIGENGKIRLAYSAEFTLLYKIAQPTTKK
jgi:hypothetical protein